MTESATYVYAVTRDAGGDTAPVELTGVAGTDVRDVTRSGLRAYVSTVPLEEFDETALRGNLEDLGWLEATARAHHGVVAAVSRTGPTAPVRLVTVYRNDDHVRRMLGERAGEFDGVLADIDGRIEWGVKAYAALAAPPAAPPAAEPADAAAGLGAGAAYLRRRRASLHRHEDARHRALTQAERVDATLTAIAVASRRHRPQDPQLSGRTEWMVLNGSYLVDEDRGDEFVAAVESLRTPEIELDVTGPWAPYSFATLEASPAPPDRLASTRPSGRTREGRAS